MRALFLAVVGCLFLPGCTAHALYQSSARELLREEWLQSYQGFVKSWKPAGKGSDYQLSESENDKLAKDEAFCAKHLSLQYPVPPAEVLRSLQIVECMEGQGWDLKIDELMVM